MQTSTAFKERNRPGNRCTMGLTARLVFCATLAVLCSSSVHAQLRDLKAVSSTSQTSISYNRSVTGGDPLGKLSFDDSRLANTAGGLNPSQVRSASKELSLPCLLAVLYTSCEAQSSHLKPVLFKCTADRCFCMYANMLANNTQLLMAQVHLTYTGATNVTISWATGEGIVTAAPALNHVAEEAGPTSTVMYGTSSGNYTTNTSSTIFTSYTQLYNFSNANPNLNYSSPLFHHVTIQNLAPSTQYYYKVGDPKLGMSQEFNFTSPPALGESSYPFALGVVADTGLTPNTTVTIQHLVDAKPQVWTLIGDFSYADDMQTNGTMQNIF